MLMLTLPLQISAVVLAAVVTVIGTCFKIRERRRLTTAGWAFIGLTFCGAVLTIASVGLTRREEMSRRLEQETQRREKLADEAWNPILRHPLSSVHISCLTNAGFSAQQLGWSREVRITLRDDAGAVRVLSFEPTPANVRELMLVCRDERGKAVGTSSLLRFDLYRPETRGRLFAPSWSTTTNRLPFGEVASGVSAQMDWDSLHLSPGIATIGDLGEGLAGLRVEVPSEIVGVLGLFEVSFMDHDMDGPALVFNDLLSKSNAYGGIANCDLSGRQVLGMLREDYLAFRRAEFDGE